MVDDGCRGKNPDNLSTRGYAPYGP